MQRLIILVCFFILANGTVFAASLTQRPTIDFGSVGYVAGSSGFNAITISANGSASPGGAGPLSGNVSGSAGTVTIGDFNIIERLFSSTVSFETNRSTEAQEIYTSGCGRVSISNFTTTNGGTSASGTASNSSVSFPLGATLTLVSFEGTQPCPISGTVTGPVQFKVGDLLGSWTDVPVTVNVNIVPYLSLTHDSNAVLNFGTICRSSTTQQTITVSPDGTPTSTNTLCPVTGASADSFTVAGYSDKSFDVSLPTSVNISNGSNSLSITNLTPSCSSNCILTNSTYSFTVGGTLIVPANSPAGDYVGHYSVTITW